MHWLSAAHLLQLSLRFLHRHCVVSLVAACPAASTRQASMRHTVFGINRLRSRVCALPASVRGNQRTILFLPHTTTQLMHNTHERDREPDTHKTETRSETTRTALAVSAATPWRGMGMAPCAEGEGLSGGVMAASRAREPSRHSSRRGRPSVSARTGRRRARRVLAAVGTAPARLPA